MLLYLDPEKLYTEDKKSVFFSIGNQKIDLLFDTPSDEIFELMFKKNQFHIKNQEKSFHFLHEDQDEFYALHQDSFKEVSVPIFDDEPLDLEIIKDEESRNVQLIVENEESFVQQSDNEFFFSFFY